jgi:hypothetical protein
VVAADPAARDGFHADLRAALQTADTALVSSTRAARLSTFQTWVAYCESLGHEPTLASIPDAETRLCHLLVFGLRVRRTGSQQTGGPVRSETVAKALLAVGAGITMLGGQDPRKQTAGADRNHPLLASFLKSLADDDSPSKRAYPANTTILDNLHSQVAKLDPAHCRALLHTFDLAIVGFFWMLRPAEYLTSTSRGRSQAFTLADITFQTPDGTFAALDPSLNDFDVTRIRRATLTFNDQKNAVKGEQITHLLNSHPRLCPVKALYRICAHLRSHGAPPGTPIYTCYTNTGVEHISPKQIKIALRRSAASLQSTTGIDPRLLSSRSLRPGGATALLCSGVDANIIQLIGRWKSDAMLRYLRVAALAHTTALAEGMLQAGAFTFAPGTYDLPGSLPQQTPEPFLSAVRREALYHAA